MLMVKFAQQCFNTDDLDRYKEFVVCRTLRVVSMMIKTRQNDIQISDLILKIGAYDLVKEALQMQKDSKPGVIF